MTRKLTKLRVDEISSCDVGAGEGTQIILMKRHDPQRRDGPLTPERLQRRKRLAEIIKRGLDAVDDNQIDETETDDNEIEEAAEGELPGNMEQIVAALMLANPTISREDVIHFLLHTASGAALASRLSSTFKAKDQPMSRIDELKDFAKTSGGMIAICKHINSEGTTAVTEHELSEMLMEHAKLNKLAGERPDQAFSRIYSADGPEGVTLRRAFQIAKNTPAMPPVAKTADTVATVSEADSVKAYEKIQKLAAEQYPNLPADRGFAKIFSDPQHAALANAAHRRPSAASAYEFPR